MRSRLSVALLVPLLALGCAGGEPPPSPAAASPAAAEASPALPIAPVAPGAAPAPAPTIPEPSPPSPAAVRAGEQALAVLGTPLFLVFKTVVCAGSAVIAVPIAAIAGLGTGPYSAEALRGLGAGLAHNCGPPYVLTPPGPDQAAPVDR